MKKYSRRILAGIMSFVLLLTMVFPVPVRADDSPGDTTTKFNEGSIGGIGSGKSYAIALKGSNKAVKKITTYFYNEITKVTGYVDIAGGKVGNDAQAFIINVCSASDKKVNILVEDKDSAGKYRYLKKEGTGAAPEAVYNAFVDPGDTTYYSETNNNSEVFQFILEGDGNDFKIKSVADSGKYAVVEGDDLKFIVPDDTNKAAEFTFIEVTDSNVVTPKPAGDSAIKSGRFVIISETKNRALNAKQAPWTQNDFLADASFDATAKKIESESAIFDISEPPKSKEDSSKKDNGTVVITCHYKYGDAEEHSMRVQNGEEVAYIDIEHRDYEDANHFVIEKADKDGDFYYIKTYAGKYAVIEASGDLRFKDKDKAEKFKFVDATDVKVDSSGDNSGSSGDNTGTGGGDQGGNTGGGDQGGNTGGGSTGGEVAGLDLNAEYAIISKTTGRALDIKKNQSFVESGVIADALYFSGSKKIAGINVRFSVQEIKDGNGKVKIIGYFDGKKYKLRSEPGREVGFFYNGIDTSDDNNDSFIIEKVGEDTFKIKSCGSNRYASIDSSSKGLLFKDNTTAEEFTFLNMNGFSSFDNSISIQSKSNGKYVKTYKSNGTALTVNGQKGDEGTVFSKV